jgi:formylglycine-generating enzyme required for sulfatase activity
LQASSITTNSATLGGNISDAGNPAYFENGVCYSTMPDTTTGSAKIPASGSGPGGYTANATGLAENTTYYVRAYATNTIGTAYGDQINFTTGSPYQINIEMVSVEGGTFQMGGTMYSSEQPIHQVTLSSFQIGKYEVTQGQWEAVMGSNPSNSYGVGDNYPVYYVSWDDIVGTSGAYTEIKGIRYYENGFIYKLNQLTGKQYRLPTEAEWEYAARGGNQSNGYTYSGSNNVDDVAWYYYNSGYSSHAVGTKQANELGIYDMSGNVYEWVGDWWDIYTADAQTNPTGPATGSYRVFRGGSWYGAVAYCRVAARISCTPANCYSDLGVRVVLVP